MLVTAVGEQCGVSDRPPHSTCEADCGKCGDGDDCKLDADCKSGYCQVGVLASLCLPCRSASDGRCPNGALCDSDGDCASGNCVGEEAQPLGACAPRPPACTDPSGRPLGCGCSSSSQCASGRCYGYDGSNWCISSGCTAPGSKCSTSDECCDFPGHNLGCYDFNPLPVLTSYRCARPEDVP
jgi:hypothetical protein